MILLAKTWYKLTQLSSDCRKEDGPSLDCFSMQIWKAAENPGNYGGPVRMVLISHSKIIILLLPHQTILVNTPIALSSIRKAGKLWIFYTKNKLASSTIQQSTIMTIIYYIVRRVPHTPNIYFFPLLRWKKAPLVYSVIQDGLTSW